MSSLVFQHELTKACETQRGSLVREAAEVVYTRDAAAVETLPQLRNDAIELGAVKQRGKPELLRRKQDCFFPCSMRSCTLTSPRTTVDRRSLGSSKPGGVPESAAKFKIGDCQTQDKAGTVPTVQCRNRTTK